MKNGKEYKGILLLLLLFAGVPLLAWQMAFSKTCATVREASKLKNTLSQISANPTDNGNRVTVTISKEDWLSNGLILDKLMPCIESNKVRVVEYQPYVNESNGDLTVFSAEITFTGSYISMLKVIDMLESDIDQCRIRSVAFEKTMEKKERKDRLKGIVIVQQLIRTP